MLRQFQSYIKQHHLLPQGTNVLVALSGGADSVALLDLLLRAGYACIAAHCNFHLRGEESNRDEQFVRELCKKLKVELYVKEFATAEYARQHKLSIEMAARELRYQWFEQLLKEKQCCAVAVAHHQNDQAETLLLNLERGTGIRGLCGMHPKNGNIIRPLLFTTHNDIINYLTLRKLPHVEDSTNTDSSISRNRIRKQLGNMATDRVKHIAQTADYMQGYNTIVQDYIRQLKPAIMSTSADQLVKLHIPALLQTIAPQTILYELLSPYGFTQTNQIFASLTRRSGKLFHSPTHTALKDRDYLIIWESDRCESSVPQITTAIRKRRNNEIYPHANEWKIIADKHIMDHKLTLRHWQKGDRFCPIGMKGKSRLLSDFFSDLHLPVNEKENVWLLCSGETIAWIVGYRLDERFKVTDNSTEVAEIVIL